jgi:hypothetical protein
MGAGPASPFFTPNHLIRFSFLSGTVQLFLFLDKKVKQSSNDKNLPPAGTSGKRNVLFAIARELIGKRVFISIKTCI